jgi:hypothetical protein
MEDVGLDRIKQSVIKPLNKLKVAAFSGCHLLRPSELLRFDDPERPQIFDTLIEALGAKSIWYKNKLKCCGGLLRGYADDVALAIARDKIVNASKRRRRLHSNALSLLFPNTRPWTNAHKNHIQRRIQHAHNPLRRTSKPKPRSRTKRVSP